jgi:uncharacterized caspase-like protein
MSAAFKTLGFQVVEGIDLDKPAFDRKIRDFAAALQGAELGVFFYAGHGLQVGGQNYLVPTDAELSTQDGLDFEMVRLDVHRRSNQKYRDTAHCRSVQRQKCFLCQEERRCPRLGGS